VASALLVAAGAGLVSKRACLHLGRAVILLEHSDSLRAGCLGRLSDTVI